MINTGGDRFYPGVDKLLVGMKKGETKSETITIGEDSILEHLREKEVVASIEVQTIQCYKLPSVEEYAKEEGFEGGAEELRASIEGELSGQYESASKDQSRVQILQKLVQLNTFEVPEGMVNQQLQALMEELSMRRQYAGEDPRKIRFSDDEIKDLRQRASFAAKAACILAAIARQEELAVSDEDLDAKIQELAGSRGQTPEAIRAYLTEENATNILKERILEEKTLNWLFESSNLVAPTPEADEAEPEKGEETGE
jgi:trigger factor